MDKEFMDLYMKISNLPSNFDVKGQSQDLLENLEGLKSNVNDIWDDYYNLAKLYYEHNGD